VQALQKTLTLEDAGLRVQEFRNYFSLTSRELVLKPGFVTLAQEVAASLGLSSQNLLTYLANTMRVGSQEVPYSLVTGIDLAPDMLARAQRKIRDNGWTHLTVREMNATLLPSP
jgi:DNA-binding CsgD family transcriptional regulator